MKTLKNLALSGTVFLSAFLLSANVSAQESKTPQLTDPEIASVAVTANQIDVQYAEIALNKSQNEDVKNFAATMKRDHTAVIKMAVDLATKLKVTPKTNAVTESLLEGAMNERANLNSKAKRILTKPTLITRLPITNMRSKPSQIF